MHQGPKRLGGRDTLAKIISSTIFARRGDPRRDALRSLARTALKPLGSLLFIVRSEGSDTGADDTSPCSFRQPGPCLRSL